MLSCTNVSWLLIRLSQPGAPPDTGSGGGSVTRDGTLRWPGSPSLAARRVVVMTSSSRDGTEGSGFVRAGGRVGPDRGGGRQRDPVAKGRLERAVAGQDRPGAQPHEQGCQQAGRAFGLGEPAPVGRHRVDDEAAVDIEQAGDPLSR